MGVGGNGTSPPFICGALRPHGHLAYVQPIVRADRLTRLASHRYREVTPLNGWSLLPRPGTGARAPARGRTRAEGDCLPTRWLK